jgi:cytochrome c553
MIHSARRRAARLVIVLLGCGMAAQASAQDAATIATQGNGNGAAPCQTCHAPNGSGLAAAGFPRLAGLDATYLLHQLDAFADSRRENPVMKLQASALTEPQREAVATYFSRMPPVAMPAMATAPFADPDHLGETLATRGRWSKQVPACEQCHGPGGVGVGPDFPPLAGQSATYLATQLKAFREGSRHNDPLGLMRHVAQPLSDQDIDAVAHWFAAQPVPAEESRP